MTISALAWAYVRFGSLPKLAGVLYGIKSVVIGVVVQALWNLAPKAVKKSSLLGIIAAAALLIAIAGDPQPLGFAGQEGRVAGPRNLLWLPKHGSRPSLLGASSSSCPSQRETAMPKAARPVAFCDEWPFEPVDRTAGR